MQARLGLTAKPVLGPRIPDIAITPVFPKTALVFFAKLDLPNELRPFPPVQLWDDHPGGTAMFFRQWFSVETGGNQNVIVQTVSERDISVVAVVRLYQ